MIVARSVSVLTGDVVVGAEPLSELVDAEEESRDWFPLSPGLEDEVLGPLVSLDLVGDGLPSSLELEGELMELLVLLELVGDEFALPPGLDEELEPPGLVEVLSVAERTFWVLVSFGNVVGVCIIPGGEATELEVWCPGMPDDEVIVC